MAYLEQNGELDYAGNVYVAQGRTVDTGHLVMTAAMARDQFYVGMSRAREKNRLYVVTGPPEPGAMSRREREAFTRERVPRRPALLERGEVEGALGIDLAPPETAPARPRAPWEAVVAQVLHKDEPLGTAIEQMAAAQDSVTNAGHLIQLTEAFWQRDVVPQIDEMIRQRIGEREYQRYLTDPERPAFLQLLRTHEIGGRASRTCLDAITARIRRRSSAASPRVSTAGREKNRPRPGARRRTWAERVPGGAVG